MMGNDNQKGSKSTKTSFGRRSKKSTDGEEKPRPLFPSSRAEGATYDYLYKLTFVGDAGTGKSCVMLRLTEDTFNYTYICTIGIDFKTFHVQADDIRYKLQIWDTSGQERFRTITRAYYRNTMAIIIVYDATKQSTFDNVPYWIQEVKMFGHPHVTMILLGTKCDCEDDKVVSYETAKALADEHNILFFEVSSKDRTSTSIEHAVVTLVAAVRQRHCELVPTAQ